jgi:hypothetical protein
MVYDFRLLAQLAEFLSTMLLVVENNSRFKPAANDQ